MHPRRDELLFDLQYRNLIEQFAPGTSERGNACRVFSTLASFPTPSGPVSTRFALPPCGLQIGQRMLISWVMCGRYDNLIPRDAYGELFRAARIPLLNFPPRYNIAPTDQIPIVRIDPRAGERAPVMARWGLIPFWMNA